MMQMFRRRGKAFPTTAVLFAALITGFTACAPLPENPPVEKDGRIFGMTEGAFRHRWWNYYERGVSFMEGELWEKAETDFKAALSQWGGEEDGRRIRTYGRHLIEYFPHRELGISFFHQGRYAEAIQELEASLSTETSAKAEFYLDRARRAKIEVENLDTGIPIISFDKSSETLLTNRMSFSVRGVAKDDTFVRSIRINGMPVRIDLSAPKIRFEDSVPLRSGENVIIVEAGDLLGNVATARRTVYCDRIGPVLNIDRLESGSASGTAFRLKGYAHDRSGIREIRVNGKPLINSAGAEISLDHDVVLSPDGGKALVEAEDRAGNRTRAEIFPGFSGSVSDGDFFQRPLLASRSVFPIGLSAAADTRGVMNDEKRRAGYRKRGDSYALLIGIDAYEAWKPLENAVHDVTVLRKVLVEHYGFSDSRIVLKKDHEATWTGLIREMKALASRLKENDNLLLYFAGHGQLDPLTGDGYWIPADGSLNDPAGWITNSSVKRIFGSGKGRHILVVADACYSGTLLHLSPPVPAEEGQARPGEAFQSGMRGNSGGVSAAAPPFPNFKSGGLRKRVLELAARKSRQIIASGGIEPVSDKGSGGHSLFAWFLLKALKENPHSVIDIEYLFNTRIFQNVTDRGGQRPVIGRMVTPADDGGQFVLVRTGKAGELPESGKENGEPDHLRTSDALSVSLSPDVIPPTIRIKGWRSNRPVYIDQVLLELNVYDEGGIQRVTVNGNQILKRPGRNLHLNSLLRLAEGENRITVECMDQVGNISREKFRIVRKIPKVFETGSRMSLVVFPFKVTGEAGDGMNALFADRLKKRDRFQIKIADDVGMNNSGKTLPEEQQETEKMRLAKKLNAEFMLTGTVAAFKNTLNIFIRLHEVDTGLLVTSQDVYGENDEPDLTRRLYDGLTVKLCDALPLLEGRIVKIRGPRVILNLGKDHQIAEGMHLVFFEENDPLKDPETGQILGADEEELGSARLLKLMPLTSHSEMLAGGKTDHLKIGGRFVMK